MHEARSTQPIVISGHLGPRGDGYRADARMTAQQARDYHAMADDHRALRRLLPNLSVLGGCCGTDDRQAAICRAWQEDAGM
jgi:hypothetical protein